jgi:Ca2+-binding RTX toxin-like protein
MFGSDGDDSIFVPLSYNAPLSTCYIDGGNGNDTISASCAGSYITGGDGNDLMTSYGVGNYVDGGAGNDKVIANGLHDLALGGAGDDLVYSDSDNAVYLLGQDGNDIVSGWNGNDYVDGGMGVDVLFGGAGTDYMIGGGDTDYFVMNDDIYLGQIDYIADFTFGSDYIGLSTYTKNKVYIFDTSYGVDVVYASSGNYYQLLITNTHDVAQVTASIYYDGV